jgi:UDP-N-acetylglucosamine acyltransferase
MKIHPTAVIEKKAELGTDVTVGPFAFIDAKTKIGDGCVIGPHAVIHPFTTLGKNCRVHAGAVLGDLPQDFSFDPREETFVEIGEGCTFREGVTVHRGSTKENRVTRTGRNCYLMALAHLAHDVQLEDDVTLANGVLLAGHVRVGRGAFLSGHAGVHQWCRVGARAMMGGHSLATQDVPPFCTLKSGAVNQLAGLNTVGLRRAGFEPDERAALKRAYKVLFRSGLALPNALAQVEKENPSGAVLELIEFIKASQRGICSA